MPDALTPRPAAATSPKAPGGICANCHAALAPAQKHCHDCGQPAHLHPPSAWEFVHEFVTHYVALEGRLWRTLGRLFLSPGSLTQAWMAGRRGQYVQPLRIYLTASILFFLALRFGGGEGPKDLQTIEAGPPVAEQSAEGAGAPDGGATDGPADTITSPLDIQFEADSAIGRFFAERFNVARERFKKRTASMSPRERGAYFVEHMVGKASFAMFFLLPVYALLLKLVYWRRAHPLGVHVVFTLHVHAFMFGLFLLLMLPWPEPIASLALMVGVPMYFLVAMRRVYGGRWSATVARAALIFFVYNMAIGAALLGLAGSALFA